MCLWKRIGANIDSLCYTRDLSYFQILEKKKKLCQFQILLYLYSLGEWNRPADVTDQTCIKRIKRGLRRCALHVFPPVTQVNQICMKWRQLVNFTAPSCMQIISAKRHVYGTLESLRLNHQRTIYFRRWGFGWVDKAQCFRSARRFGAVDSSPDFSRGFSRHGALRPLSRKFLFMHCNRRNFRTRNNFVL